jgi:hypothetical protein
MVDMGVLAEPAASFLTVYGNGNSRFVRNVGTNLRDYTDPHYRE